MRFLGYSARHPMNADHPSDSSPRFSYAVAGRILFLCGGAALLLAGCATTHEVRIDSLAKPNAEASISYEIKNRNPLVADDSLRYKEAAGMVKTALSGKG